MCSCLLSFDSLATKQTKKVRYGRGSAFFSRLRPKDEGRTAPRSSRRRDCPCLSTIIPASARTQALWSCPSSKERPAACLVLCSAMRTLFRRSWNFMVTRPLTRSLRIGTRLTGPSDPVLRSRSVRLSRPKTSWLAGRPTSGRRGALTLVTSPARVSGLRIGRICVYHVSVLTFGPPCTRCRICGDFKF